MSFSSLLIANRGEIAARILSTAGFMGLETICVYSEADANAPYIAQADKAVALGPSDPAQSYLNMDKILKAAIRTKAQAIHPGYGFLSENADFARACEEAGLVFIGPNPKTIALMADKAEARALALSAGVPVIPGYHGQDQSFMAFKAAAKAIGLPLMIKAAAGGGGMGIVRLDDLADLKSALKSAADQAKAAFGDGRLILEKMVEKARHIEVQILADMHGNVIHLGTRECSIQRRHQKLIEEAPAPGLSKAQTDKVTDLALKLAKAVGYVGAGTVEFLMGADGQFHFLEMNTRLQVEHTVTEAITGEDIVEQQIRIAKGEALSLSQDDIKFYGHALEARIYAEDAPGGFLPTGGTVEVFETDPILRVDSAIGPGSKITRYYDPLLAKCIAQADTREQARQALLGGLKHSVILGLTHNMDFLAQVLKDKDFIAGQVTTDFLDTRLERLVSRLKASTAPAHIVPLACALKLRLAHEKFRAMSAWPADLSGWASATPPEFPLRLAMDNQTYETTTVWTDTRTCCVSTGQDTHTIAIDITGPHKALCKVDGVCRTVHFADQLPKRLSVHMDGRTYTVTFAGDHTQSAHTAPSSGRITAPMHGRIADVFVETGAQVEAGQPLCVLEAMKMRHEICAPCAGQIQDCYAENDAQIASGDKLFDIKEA